MSCLAILVGITGFGTADAAGSASVSITPATATTPSGAAGTYTLTVSCSVTGGCNGTTVTFPSTTITGNGDTKDFGAWVGKSSCPAVTRTSSGGQVTFTYGNVPTGTMQCTFPVAPPNYKTFNNTQVTITPTINGSNFASSTGSAATLTVTAGHTDRLIKDAPAQVTSGLPFSYTLGFFCGGSTYTGDVGLSALTITDPLPANFTYSSYSTPKTLPGSFAYDAGAHTLTYSDPTGTTCGNTSLYTPINNSANEVVIFVAGTAAANGVADPVGSSICNTATVNFTYLDGTTATSAPRAACSTVAGRVPTNFLGKTSYATTFSNAGQYRFPPTNAAWPYTFPGDWDGSGTSALYQIQLSATVNNAGANFAVQDPLPCLTNFSGQTYSSNPPGAPFCAAPAFIPTLITATGFAPSASNAVTLVHPDGTTSTVNYTAGTGWVIPTSPPVAEIDFSPFPEEGDNSTPTMLLEVQGYAAPATLPTSPAAGAAALLTNTVTAQAYEVGSTTPLAPQLTRPAIILVVSPTQPSGTVVRPVLRSSYNGNCTENVGFTTNGAPFPNSFEIAHAPSQAIYLDYLAPAGATGISGQNVAFTLQQVHSRGYWYQMGNLAGGQKVTTPAIAPTVTPNYNGTGRTLYQWVIPAGTITRPGDYAIYQTDLRVTLEPGCAGTYQNDFTVGYGAPVTTCLYGIYYGISTGLPPKNPTANGDLQANATPLPNNYCGTSAPLVITPVNPGFRVDKTVQGNLDAHPISAGGIGNVSPSGGTATYNLTFTNSGGANLVNPVMYDILPVVGDTGARALTPRNSQFPVALTGVGPLPSGVTVTYSTSTKACRPEVLPSNPGCVNDWSSTPPSPLSSVTALRFAYTGTVVVNGAPGTNSFSIPFTVATPPSGSGQVAWNSVGTTAYAGAGGALIAPAESSVTGLRTLVGPTIVKASTTPSYSKPGDTISYTFTVTNNTAVPLTDVRVVDNLVDAPAGNAAPAVSCQSLSAPAAACSGATTTLRPNQSATFVATSAATQADVDQGSVSDLATVSANPPTGDTLTNASGTVTVPAVQTSGLSLSKSADPSTLTEAGQEVTYSFLVTNKGNVTLTGVKVDETAFSGAGTAPVPSCPGSTLPPAAVMTCTATYTVTQADVDAGSIVNTAAATGRPPSGPALTSLPSSATVTALANGAIRIVKSASPSEAASFTAGQLITYSYVVTNTGNVTLHQVTVNETTFTGTGPVPAPQCPVSTLAPGAQTTCTATYTLMQADIDGGSITNTANATGDPPIGSKVIASASSLTIPEGQSPALTLVKGTTPTKVTAAGQKVTYTFLVANTGNVTLKNMAVQEAAFSGTGTTPVPSCPSSTAPMLPGIQVTCTASYTATQADIDAGHITNRATATASPPTGPTITSAPSSATVTAPGSGLIRVVKSASPSAVASFTPGQLITYSYVVTNTGNVTLSQVKVNETTFTGNGPLPVAHCPSSTLAPGAQTTCTATYSLTQADIDGGSVTNVATATGDPPAGAQAIAEASSVTIPQAPSPALTVVKAAARVTATGEKVTYTFLVTNTGNLTLSDVKVNEIGFSGTGPVPVPSCPADAASILPGIEVTCTATYTATQVDANAGSVTNTATATATPPSESALASAPSSATIRVAAGPGGDPTGTPTPPVAPRPPSAALPITGSDHFRKLLTAGATFTVIGGALLLALRRLRATAIR